jgi:hypothetical protein
MKIIFGSNSFETTDHAREYVRAQREYARRSHPRDWPVHGIATHSARFAQTCDECGLTYWTADPWASHRDCNPTSNKGDLSLRRFYEDRP